MKKIFNFIVVLGLLFFVFQVGITLLKKSHLVNYKIEIGEKKFDVREEYIKTKEDDYYFFKVTLSNNEFFFDTDNKFNKQKNVIEEIKLYEKEDLICLSPVYIKNNDDAQIICSVDGKQTSYTSIKEQYDLSAFVDSLDNFNNDKFDSSNTKVSFDNLIVYKDNLYDDCNLIVYDYKELLKVTKNNRERIKFSSYDIYYNEMGRLIDKYYVLPNFENKPEYSGMMLIDVVNGEKEIISFDDEISTNLYINGIVDNKLYLFDKSNLIQYEISPDKKSYRIVGNISTNGQYYNGEWSTRNIHDFSRQELVFNEVLPINDAYVKAFETEKYYYYYNINNEFYKLYKTELNNPIFLFKYEDIKEVSVVNDYIYFINDDSIYRYDDTGIKRLVENNEFKYNYKNIYGVYCK